MNQESSITNNKIKDFWDLKAWQEGHQLVLHIYKLTSKFPKTEIYGIINQMRRCAISVTSNTSEGFSRKSNKEKIQFFYITLGSLTELQNQLIISKDLNYLDIQEFNKAFNQTSKVQRIVNGLIKSTNKLNF